MSLIITLTINPAVDKSSRVDHIVPEKKLSCEAPKYEPGGGGINVSRALKRLGTDSTAVFPAAGRTGLRLQDLLKDEGVAQRAVETRNETRENFSVVDISSNQQYRFGMPGPELYPNEAVQFLPLIRQMNPQWLVMSGSLATGLASDFFAEIAGEMRKHGAKIIVDTSGEALKNTVDAGVYLLKPNLGELSQLVGAESLDMESVADAARDAALEIVDRIAGLCQCEAGTVLRSGQWLFLVHTDQGHGHVVQTFPQMAESQDDPHPGVLENVGQPVRWVTRV